MSDYLWDKTGEPDAEVERLENLFAGMRFEPREFDATAPPAALGQPARKSRLLFFRPALAVAATVALVAFAALMFAVVSRDKSAEKTEPPTLARQAESAGQVAPAQGLKVDEKVDESVASADALVAGGEVEATPNELKPRRAPASRETSRREASEQARVSKARATIVPKRDARGDLKSPGAEIVAVSSEEQRRAKEQLMFALRLTSAKFNVVQRTTRPQDNPKAASEERDKIR